MLKNPVDDVTSSSREGLKKLYATGPGRELVRDACVQFAQFAKTRDLTREEVENCFYDVFFQWHFHMLPDNFYLKGLASSIKRTAAALCHALEKLHQHHERTARRLEGGKYGNYDSDMAAFETLPFSN